MWLDYKGKRHFLPTEMPEEPGIDTVRIKKASCILLNVGGS